MSMTGNKGEWSELYVLLYLLHTSRLYSANESLELLSDDAFFTVLSIFRTEFDRTIRFDTNESKNSSISIYVNNRLVRELPKEKLAIEARNLYRSITNNSKTDGAFKIDSADDILNALECTKFKSPSGNKIDIDIKLNDYKTGYTGRYGFSIKSQLGNPPTLLNASRATNFKYEVCGMNAKLADRINSIETREKITDRINAIYSGNAWLRFVKAESEHLSSNLMLVDSLMEIMVGEILLTYYRNKTNHNRCKDILSLIEKDNPLNYPRPLLFYSYKFKKLLCSVALGMVPNKDWNGQDDANGGYIVVKQNGDVLAYHIYNRNHFESYLLENTRFETPSTSRHQFMSIYSENQKYYIDLNLQIRFINP